jgi:hypothetical protein
MNNSGEASFDLVYSPSLTTSRIPLKLTNSHPPSSWGLNIIPICWVPLLRLGCCLRPIMMTWVHSLHVKLVADKILAWTSPSDGDKTTHVHIVWPANGWPLRMSNSFNWTNIVAHCSPNQKDWVSWWGARICSVSESEPQNSVMKWA